MKFSLKRTFTKVMILSYCLGALGHIMVIIFKPTLLEMPYSAHSIVALLAGYSGLGLMMYFKKINFKNLVEKSIYAFILVHLVVSALLHAYSVLWHDNAWLKIFKPSYSYYAGVYFAVFAYYAFKLDKKLK